MSILDQKDLLASLDPKSMKSLVETFPEHIAATAEGMQNLEISLPQKPSVLLVTGLGGSAIGGDLARSIAGNQMTVPMIINRDYDLPAFVNAGTTIIACSYSGNTEETLSAYEQGRKAGSSIICITSGGKLEAMAKRDGYPTLRLPGGLPPRAALGYSLITLLASLQSMQLVSGIVESIQDAVHVLNSLKKKYWTEMPETSNPAKILARSLNGKIVAIYGSNSIMDAAAFRWRSQIAENAKNLAFHHVLPEMNHNELVGWKYPEEALKNIGVILLRDKDDHPQVQKRFELTRDVIASRAGVVHEVWSVGKSRLARVLSILYLGDFVSLYMAYLNNVDPSPVQVIDEFKSRLGSGH
jgi:glucose/mannose-6-phosphate isomerase